MIFNCHGGPLDGMTIDAELEVGFHRVNHRYGYYFDGAAFHFEWIRELRHETKAGHTWIFFYTCKRRLMRACGYLTQTCRELWRWQDAAEVTQKLRDIEWEAKQG